MIGGGVGGDDGKVGVFRVVVKTMGLLVVGKSLKGVVRLNTEFAISFQISKGLPKLYIKKSHNS